MLLVSSAVQMPGERHSDMHDPDAVVAERTLKCCDTGRPVVVKVCKPVPDPEGDWACGFEITGLDTSRSAPQLRRRRACVELVEVQAEL